jgi:hypothetical protein
VNLTVKPTSTVDVEVILTARLGGTAVKYVTVQEDGENAVVKAKGVLPYTVWLSINKAAREMGGTYKRRENLWLIPLNKKPNV